MTNSADLTNVIMRTNRIIQNSGLDASSQMAPMFDYARSVYLDAIHFRVRINDDRAQTDFDLMIERTQYNKIHQAIRNAARRSNFR